MASIYRPLKLRSIISIKNLQTYIFDDLGPSSLYNNYVKKKLVDFNTEDEKPAARGRLIMCNAAR